jgi:hypothetical protein
MHGSYNPTTLANDVAVVRYVGADASTPIIPHMTASEDDLSYGALLTWVGYGQTETNLQNTVRFSVSDTIDYVDSMEIWSDEQDGTGTCKGDSGGPALRATPNGERVAGVSSYGTSASCSANPGYSVSMRISTQQSFIDGFLAEPIGPVSCDTCRTLAGSSFGGCTAESTACGAATDCEAFLSCVDACGGDTACSQSCVTQHSSGYADYLAYFDCACNDCTTECANEPACTAPTCGMAYADPTCNGCVEAQCCSETQACADDTACRVCATSSSPPASCDQDTLYRAFWSCSLGTCGADCGVPCGFSNTGACGDCISQSCCSQGSACAADATCFQCATGSSSTGCSQSTLLNELFTCLGGCAGDPCGAGGGGTGGTGGTAGSGATGGSAGAGADADAGIGGAGGAGAVDAGTDAPVYYGSSSPGGCRCRTVPAAPRESPWWLAALAGALAVAARRRCRGAD